ncbi:MAG: hypothetical protein KKH88_04835 [Nanoarchaeota archaeon]|nr:hypothetical protein [Nanoarchaeota archaeon]
MDKDFALLYGIMLGDGCIGRYKRKDRKRGFYYNVCITCNAKDDWPFINSIVLPLLEKFVGRKINPRKPRKNVNVIELNFSSKELFKKLNDVGFPIGKKGAKLKIPDIFYEKKFIKQIIQGFFATDGSLVLTKNPNKYYPRLEFHCIHKDMLEQMLTFFKKEGFNAHLYKCKSKKPPFWKNEQQRYRIQMNGKKNLLLFNEKIGFVNPKQEKRFRNFLKYDKEWR